MNRQTQAAVVLDERRTAVWSAIVLTAMTCLLFGRTLRYPWIQYDDPIHFTHNPGLNPVTWRSVLDFWSHPYEKLYIPVSYSFFAIETLVSRLTGGMSPQQPLSTEVFHACSIALHGAATLLVWRLLGRLGVTNSFARLCGASLFACHPIQVESVAWISEQRGLLSAVFSLVALNIFADRTPHLAENRGLQWDMRTGCSLTCFVLAALAKPQAVSVPLMFLFLNGHTWRAPIALTAARLVPWVAMMAVIVFLTQSVQPTVGLAEAAPLWLRPVIAGDAMFHYVRTLALPLSLSIDYGRTPETILADPWSYVRAAVVVTAMVGFAIVPSARCWRLPLAISVSALFPVLGFFPFVFQAISTVADRYAYLAMLGPALALGMLLQSAGWARIPVVVVALAWLTACLGATWLTIPTWRNTEALFTRAVEVNPRSFHGHVCLGRELLDQGKYSDALMHYDAAISLDTLLTSKPMAYYGRAVAKHRLGDLDVAAQAYRKALAIDDTNANAHNDFGVLLGQQGRTVEAVVHFKAAIALKPDLLEAAQNLESAQRILLEESR